MSCKFAVDRGAPMNHPQPGWPYGQPAHGPSSGIAVIPKLPAASQLTARWQFTPKLVLDGYHIPSAGWNRILAPAAPGRHHLQAYSQDGLYRRQFGRADLMVDVAPGQWVELEYRPPPFGGPGSLGPPTTGVDQASKVIFGLIAGLLLGIPALIFIVFVIASVAAK
ncbi:hypothetical protein [Mycobacterium asiaticum]|uniref:hypothetical protein n=1 Tax=Mycobacterium asiaticum TaxID=1790 RepID=UPI000ACC6FF6|nr:hypothetical protein [Mycobacterium asiaticum]